MRKKQRNQILILILILGVAVFYLVSTDKINLGTFTIPPTASPIQPFPLTLTGSDASSYTCEADYCLVSGTMTLTSPTPTDVVVFRYHGSYSGNVFIDTSGDLILEQCTPQSTGQKRPGGTRLPFNTPGQGYAIFLESTGTFIYQSSSPEGQTTPYYKYACEGGGSGSDFSPTPTGSCPSSLEMCVQEPLYQGDFNFCPLGDTFYPYCDGTSQLAPVPATAIGGQSYSTSEIELTKGGALKTITFDPKNADGSQVTSKLLTIKQFDSSTCLGAIESEQACDNNPDNPAKHCSNPQLTCPSGTTLYDPDEDTVSCSNPFRGYPKDHRFSSGEPICHVGVHSYYSPCTEPLTDYTRYTKCTGTKYIDGVSCGDWGTSQFTAPEGKECFLIIGGDISDQHAPGGAYQPGDLKCPTCDGVPCVSCVIGTKEGVDGTPYYQKCVYADGCHNDWQQVSCNSPKVWNTEEGDCICPTEDSCSNPSQKVCDGTRSYKSCVPTGSGCYAWSDSSTTCTGEFYCQDKHSSEEEYDSCNCIPPGANKCVSGTIQCINSTSYKKCEIQAPSSQCLDYRGSYSDFDTGLYRCIGSQIIPREDVGCAYETNPSSELCSTDVDSRQTILESCNEGQNECQPTVDSYSATASDTTKCVGNSVYFAKKYTATRYTASGEESTTVDIYRWELKTDAEGSIQGTCPTEYICIKPPSPSEPAYCGLVARYIGIITPSEIGIGDLINGVRIELTSEVPSRANKPIKLELLDTEGSPVLDSYSVPVQKITLTDSQGKVTINLNYAHPRSEELVLKVTASGSDGQFIGSPYVATKPLTIKNKMALVLTCPTNAFIEKPVLCFWTSIPSTNQYTISLLQGTSPLSYNLPTTTSLEFIPLSIDTIKLSVTANLEGYLSSEKNTTIYPQPTDIILNFLINNKDIAEYPNGVASGSAYQFGLGIKETNGDYSTTVQAVSGQIQIPSGTWTTLLFTKQGTNWVTSYNLEQAGQAYPIRGEVLFTDRSNEPFAYTISTASSKTEDWWSLYMPYLIGGGIFALVLVIFLSIMALRKKR